MKKGAFIAVAVVVFLTVGIALFMHFRPAASAPASQTKPPVIVGFALGALSEDRWLTDESDFIQQVKQQGGVVITEQTNYDVPTQISQIENLVSQGAKVIVVVAADSSAIDPAIDAAHAAGVKVIAYDRMINDKNVDLYVSFDNVKVGELEAQGVLDAVSKGNFAYIGGSPTDNNALLVQQGSMQVLQPYIKSGAIKLVLNSLTPNWDSSLAYKTMKDYLSTGKTVDAVVAANDGTAFGVVQALTEAGLAGKVPVSGQDAELSACQRIVAGTQTVTVYKPISEEADAAAGAAVAMAEGQAPTVNATTNNGLADVPSYLLQPTAVTKANMADTVIKDGFHTYAEVYGTSTAAAGH